MPHAPREPIAARHPQHVTQRIIGGVPSLRTLDLCEIVRGAIERAQRADFRITHFSIQSNHLHVIIEASSNEVRTQGLKALYVSIAKRVNRLVGRDGALFPDRYHSRALKTPREVRNAIRYVLNNARHHVERPDRLGPTWIDPCSSAVWFDGWSSPIAVDAQWKRELLERPPPIARPQTWLLSIGWRRHGPLRFDEVPGSSVAAR